MSALEWSTKDGLRVTPEVRHRLPGQRWPLSSEYGTYKPIRDFAFRQYTLKRRQEPCAMSA